MKRSPLRKVSPMNLFKVITLLPSSGGGVKSREVESFYVASDIKNVIAELQTDLDDEATQILMIAEFCPILKILK